MKKKIAVEFPPPDEWDFRNVQEPQLKNATLYEYARTCDAIREATLRWLNRRHKGKTIREIICNALNERIAAGKREVDLAVFAPCLGVANFEIGFEATRNWGLLFLIACHRPDFPAPWLTNGKSPVNLPSIPNTRRVRIEPTESIAEDIKRWCAEGHTPGFSEADHLIAAYGDTFIMPRPLKFARKLICRYIADETRTNGVKTAPASPAANDCPEVRPT